MQLKKLSSVVIALLANAQLLGVYHWAIDRIDNQSDYFVEIENTAGEFGAFIEAYSTRCDTSRAYHANVAQSGKMIDIKCRAYVIKPKSNLRVNGSGNINQDNPSGCLIPHHDPRAAAAEGILRITIWKPLSGFPVAYQKVNFFLQGRDFSGRGRVLYSRTTEDQTALPNTPIEDMESPEYYGIHRDAPFKLTIDNTRIIFGGFQKSGSGMVGMATLSI